eukprot:CAMPEP_0194527110 /NCGR_PEP_ID=MMETSP0253-20130528/63104_1 /TAXON_ID=2966 /ORGANISM="Noctiluca scintillans" /LENGTH=130 /DNA_ID=CAMNT_0039371999 /DNA_START=39 /DNA_END=431 /DNA_ORIENTATION=+
MALRMLCTSSSDIVCATVRCTSCTVSACGMVRLKSAKFCSTAFSSPSVPLAHAAAHSETGFPLVSVSSTDLGHRFPKGGCSKSTGASPRTSSSTVSLDWTTALAEFVVSSDAPASSGASVSLPGSDSIAK